MKKKYKFSLPWKEKKWENEKCSLYEFTKMRMEYEQNDGGLGEKIWFGRAVRSFWLNSPFCIQVFSHREQFDEPRVPHHFLSYFPLLTKNEKHQFFTYLSTQVFHSCFHPKKKKKNHTSTTQQHHRQQENVLFSSFPWKYLS